MDLLEERNVRLVLAEVSEEVKDELNRSGLIERMNKEACYTSIGNVVSACRLGPG
jgi:SulP family sulfate permease